MTIGSKRGISIGTKLLLGVIVMVIALGSFGLYLTGALNKVRDSFSDINVRYDVLKDISSLENISTIQSDATKSYLLSSDDAWVEVYDSVSLEFDLLLEESLNNLQGTTQYELLQAFHENSDKLRGIELLIIANVREGQIEKATALFNEEYQELELESLEMLSDVRLSMEESVSEIIQANRVLILFSENALVAFLVALILFVTVVALAVSFSLSGSVRELHSAVEGIMGGDLRIRARVRSRDEIGQLAIAFNKMTARLAAAHEGLEKKVEERTADLVEVNEDLEEERNRIDAIRAQDEAILASIGDGVVVLSDTAEVMFMNSAGASLLGCELHQCKGRPVGELLHSVSKSKTAIPVAKWPGVITVKEGKSISSNDYVVTTLDNRKFPVSLTACPIVVNGSIIGSVVTFRDISHEKDVDRAKTEFVSLASHQLKGPLTAIRWNAELLEDDPDLTKEQSEVLAELSKANQNMVDIVNKLLNISRIEKGTFSVSPERTDLRELASGVIEENVEAVKERNISIVPKFPDVLPLVMVDINLMRIVFQNLISNAVKYSKENGRVEVLFSKEGEEIIFSVADSGIGIPAAAQPHIFENMFRADNALDDKIDGTGLGLYMVKQILDKTGGKIWFESKEKVGTTFYVSIPLAGMKSRKGSKKLS